LLNFICLEKATSSFYLASRIKISRKFLKTRLFWFFFGRCKKEWHSI